MFVCLFLFVVVCSKYMKGNREGLVETHCYDDTERHKTCTTCDDVAAHYKDKNWKWHDHDMTECKRIRSMGSQDIDVTMTEQKPSLSRNPQFVTTGKYYKTPNGRLDDDSLRFFESYNRLKDDVKEKGQNGEPLINNDFISKTCVLKIETNENERAAIEADEKCEFSSIDWISSKEMEQCRSIYDEDVDVGIFKDAQRKFYDKTMNSGIDDYFNEGVTPEKFPTLVMKSKDSIVKLIKIPCKKDVTDDNKHDPEVNCYLDEDGISNQNNIQSVPHCDARDKRRNELKLDRKGFAKRCLKAVGPEELSECRKYYDVWLPYMNNNAMYDETLNLKTNIDDEPQPSRTG